MWERLYGKCWSNCRRARRPFTICVKIYSLLCSYSTWLTLHILAFIAHPDSRTLYKAAFYRSDRNLWRTLTQLFIKFSGFSCGWDKLCQIVIRIKLSKGGTILIKLSQSGQILINSIQRKYRWNESIESSQGGNSDQIVTGRTVATLTGLGPSLNTMDSQPLARYHDYGV